MQFEMANAKKLALSALFVTILIYGVTFTIAKDVMPQYIKPFGLILLRVTGAVVVFWFVGFFVKAPSIEKKDYKRIFLVAFFGVGLNMLTFF